MKTCPQCGKEMADTVKFCINCGYQFPVTESQPTQPQPEQGPVQAASQSAASQPQPEPAPQPTPGQASPTPDQAGPTPNYQQQAAPGAGAPAAPNETLEKAKHASRNYWGWLIRSVAHPSDDSIGGNKFFGLASMVLMALFDMIAFVKLLSNATSAASGFVSNTESGFNSLFGTDSTAATQAASQASSSIIFGTGIRLLVLFFVINIAIFSAGYFAQRVIAPKQQGYLQAMTEYGRYLALPVFFSAAIAILGLLGGLAVSWILMILMILSYSIQSIAMYQIALSHGKKAGFDSLYSILLINVLLSIVIGLIVAIFGGSVFTMLENLF